MKYLSMLLVVLFSGQVFADPRAGNGEMHLIRQCGDQDQELKIKGVKIPVSKVDGLAFVYLAQQPTFKLPLSHFPDWDGVSHYRFARNMDNSNPDTVQCETGVCVIVDDGVEYSTKDWRSVIHMWDAGGGEVLVQPNLKCDYGVANTNGHLVE